MLGLIAGALAGIVGVGSGVLIVPVLVYLFGFSQKMAQGTTLALLIPPIGIFAAYNYFKAGQVDIKAAIFIIIGFLVGSFVSSHYAVGLQSTQLTRIFGFFLLAIAIKMIISA